MCLKAGIRLPAAGLPQLRDIVLQTSDTEGHRDLAFVVWRGTNDHFIVTQHVFHEGDRSIASPKTERLVVRAGRRADGSGFFAVETILNFAIALNVRHEVLIEEKQNCGRIFHTAHHECGISAASKTTWDHFI